MAHATLAEKIDRLFQAAHGRGEPEPGYPDVAADIFERTGVKISTSYLWELRTGRATNPRKAHLEAIAAYFDVSPSYFYESPEADAIHGELEELIWMRDSEMRSVMERSVDLDARGRQILSGIVDQLLASQKRERENPDRPGEGSGPSE